MVFNILVHNDDDHLHNHGFLWDAEGKGWRLSPLYDVVPNAGVAANDTWTWGSAARNGSPRCPMP